MSIRKLLTACAATAVMATPALAQFSSDLPGVPRASLPLRGNTQSRTEFEFAGYRIPETAGAADTMDAWTIGLRIGHGRSYRVGNRLELGFDLTILEGLITRPPEYDTNAVFDTTDSPLTGRGFALYGLRLGAKFRPLTIVSPEGYGFDVAVGAAFQPSVQPVFGLVTTGDTTLTGGLLGAGADDEGTTSTSTSADADIFGAVHASFQLAVMASYRARRLMLDAALVSERVISTQDTTFVLGRSQEDLLAMERYEGIAPRVGASVRLRPGLSAGISWWGTGAPPWRDRVNAMAPEVREQSFGVVLSFGSRQEAGTDFILASPTGAFGESVRLYIRGRSTH